MGVETKFAPTCPAPLLQQLAEKHPELRGDYDLVLSHDVASRPIEYEAAFASFKGHPSNIVIIDNSAAEMGCSVGPGIVKRAAELLSPYACVTIIVLPDVLMSRLKTLRAVENAWHSPGWRWVFESGYGCMYVPQGETFEDWCECLQGLAETYEPGWIGIAKNVQDKLGTSRLHAIHVTEALLPGAKIHLLGMSDDFVDDVLAAKHPKVVGMDSAVPLRLDEPLRIGMTGCPPRGSWWQDIANDDDPRLKHMMIENLKRIKKWIQPWPAP